MSASNVFVSLKWISPSKWEIDLLHVRWTQVIVSQVYEIPVYGVYSMCIYTTYAINTI